MRPVYGALLVVAAGFVVLLLGWGTVASEPTVSEQLPILLGLGLGGVALVVAGAAGLAIGVARRDAELLRQAHAELVAALGAGASDDEDRS